MYTFFRLITFVQSMQKTLQRALRWHQVHEDELCTFILPLKRNYVQIYCIFCIFTYWYKMFQLNTKFPVANLIERDNADCQDVGGNSSKSELSLWKCKVSCDLDQIEGSSEDDVETTGSVRTCNSLNKLAKVYCSWEVCPCDEMS
jgi:hypothetical protein